MAKREKRLEKKKRSLYFLIWAAISALCLLLLLLFTFSQRVVLRETFQQQTTSEMTTRGQAVKNHLKGGMPEDENEASDFVRDLATDYGVGVAIVTKEGVPQYSFVSDKTNFEEEIKKIEQKIAEVGATVDNGKYALYQSEEYSVYVCPMGLADGDVGYLYIAKDVSYINIIVAEMGTRSFLIVGFVLLLAFVVAAAVSGLITKPLGEIKDKAKRLAEGDFSVDFHGEKYGLELSELADTLNFARSELFKTDEMRKELIANVSHDFKTPLTMIKGCASMIIEISGDDKQKREKHAGVIIAESDRLTALVEDLLDLTKLQSDTSGLKKELLDLTAYTRQEVEKFECLCETHGYEFFLDVDEEVWVEADRVKIGQALHNLIGNAVNYTGEDKKVYVSLKKTDEKVRFSVRDTGVGIPKEEQKDIWNRYYRASGTHKRPVRGTGLGLSIVRRVLETERLVRRLRPR